MEAQLRQLEGRTAGAEAAAVRGKPQPGKYAKARQAEGALATPTAGYNTAADAPPLSNGTAEGEKKKKKKKKVEEEDAVEEEVEKKKKKTKKRDDREEAAPPKKKKKKAAE